MWATFINDNQFVNKTEPLLRVVHLRHTYNKHEVTLAVFYRKLTNRHMLDEINKPYLRKEIVFLNISTCL